jgi:hypothetical protein
MSENKDRRSDKDAPPRIGNDTNWKVKQHTTSLLDSIELRSEQKKELKETYGEGIFLPTKDHLRFLNAILSPKSGNQFEDWCDSSNISQTDVTIWRNTPGFLEWILSEVEKRFAFYKIEWMKIGVHKMRHDVKTWVEMGKLFFPKGITNSPAEKGSKRESLENELKEIIELKNAN